MKTSYEGLLTTMMDAILAGDAAPASTYLRDKPNFPAYAQLGIYAEGYRIRLHEAVESAYPALREYLGKKEFASLAVGFIALHPSRYFNLDKYPIAFAPYVAKHCTDAFARELALLEGAIHDVYQRAETPAADPLWMSKQPLETLANIPLLPREASCLLAFTADVNGYLAAQRAGEKPAATQKHNWLLVLRHKHQVQRLTLEESEYVLLSLLAEGLTLAVALEDGRLAPYCEQEEFAASLQRWLARWVSEGVLRQPS